MLPEGNFMSSGHLRDEHTKKTVHGQADHYVLGRSSQADLVFECDQMSRQHLEVVRIEQGYAFRDLDSTNGVFLNGVRIHSVNLCEGDQLQIGNLVLVYHEAVV